MHTGQRVALAGMAVSGALAVIKIVAGSLGHSTAVVADGCESAADVFSSGVVFLGLTLAAKPADEDHPYGHGRVEILSGLLIGLMLAAAGALISYSALQRLGQPHAPVALFVVWPLALSLLAKSALSVFKFRNGRKLKSVSLEADEGGGRRPGGPPHQAPGHPSFRGRAASGYRRSPCLASLEIPPSWRGLHVD